MLKFHRLKVKEVRRETTACVSVAFEVPAPYSRSYQFLPGQYLTLRTEIDGEEVRRSYSICSSPGEGELRVAIKKIPGGKFSTFANDRLRPGEMLDVMTPTGNFHVPLDAAHQKQYVAFAAGSGITPVISLLKTILVQEPRSTFLLFYGNRTTDSIIFREELEGLKNRHLGRFSLVHVLSREDTGSDLLSGRIDPAKLPLIFSRIAEIRETDEFFLCGPAEMVVGLKAYLENTGVDRKKIHVELFHAGTEQHPNSNLPQSHTVPGLQTQVHIRLDGNALHFKMKGQEQTLLDAALAAGADLPFSCKGGVCCTCKARLLEGKVEMALNYALEPEEVAAGYILTCQARPLTDVLNVDFDQ
jgi:ring-1,2-phenylacetyl-CoA epoxidase subunit PaaE